MVDDQSIALSAAALSPSVGGRELDVVVGEEEEAVVVDAVGLAPGGHDEWVVASEDGNDIDALGLELWELLDVVWDVLGGAGWGEGTWEGEEDDLLVGPLCEVC